MSGGKDKSAQSRLERLRSRKRYQRNRSPINVSLVAAMLDSGDPIDQRTAMKVAMEEGSRPMLEALLNFALGMCGPDSMRFKALVFLQKKAFIGAGPHRVFTDGKWVDTQLFTAEINPEPVRSSVSPRIEKLVVDGIYDMQRQNYNLAEKKFKEALEEEPDNCTAAYNLAAISAQRDGRQGFAKARAALEQLAKDFPNYRFGTIALAQFAGMDGDFQKAHELLWPILSATKMHASEATALFGCQIQLAIAERNFSAASRSFDLFCQVARDDDANIPIFRKRIDDALAASG